MKKVLITVLLTIIGILILEAAACVACIYSGSYDISIQNHDNRAINWALDTGMTHSVARHAKNIQAPPLTDPAMVQTGFKHYHKMCASCHGAPGVDREDIAMGLWPHAPNLVKTVPEWTPAELFWITKNGIKFSAMPAWGPTHKDESVWAIVAFLEKLPHLSSADYSNLEQSLTQQTPKEATGEHEHSAH